MSASLVGSEMCIRDRDVAVASVLLVKVGQSRELWRALEFIRECECGSVSYTHLTLPTICSV
eukprot:8456798-Alexandrium_andersonii.AAC.1